MREGLLIVISAPSGGGKGTVLQALFAAEEDLKLSVSATTRGPRPGEVHGREYYFLSEEEFQGLIDRGEMLEHARFVDHSYGTPREPVRRWQAEGKDVVLEIEVQGGAQVKRIEPNCVSIFLTPPSLAVLEQRLRGRGTEDEETVRKRLAQAREELSHAGEYDYLVINDRLEDAVDDVRAILRAERRRSRRNEEQIERMLTDAQTQ